MLMRDTSRDRVHAVQSVQTSVRRHGLAVMAAVVLALVISVLNFALGHAGVGVAAVIAGLLAFGAGMDWLAMDSGRVRQAESGAPTTRRAPPT
ncbi:hypothetical protein MCNS_26260 [Mycobacterium conspicuum]|uniref:Uncharacterized protein n=2 Tax=Mycobacterium conspicuum TaxID=44010 RepID=A0A1X1SSU7_9MYCO|nr:hypothetical protein AWC00_28155 [Mycobacterium conspicuum]BBZ39563.1 hypothetical protein MCNS_26260 [Mycobacterium conspicuum]